MIPAFSAAGVLPPFFGDPGAPAQRSPYAVRSDEVIQRFATSDRRREILRGWLQHRAALHELGFVEGFQWLDGSFCERLAGREPNDLDLVTFYVPPPGADLRQLLARFRPIFDRGLARVRYHCDVFYEGLHLVDGAYRADPRRVSYWYSLFSHRRDDFLWKGILEVPLAPAADALAIRSLGAATSSPPPPVAP